MARELAHGQGTLAPDGQGPRAREKAWDGGWDREGLRVCLIRDGVTTAAAINPPYKEITWEPYKLVVLSRKKSTWAWG